ncbi:MAG: hypothetical protein AB1758_25420 [Candidatus Eremiobacterota bacterium]
MKRHLWPILLIAGAAMLGWASAGRFVPLYARPCEADSEAIQVVLRECGIPHRARPLRVLESQVHRARLELARQGLPRVPWGQYRAESLSRHLEEDLARTLESLSRVADAEVSTGSGRRAPIVWLRVPRNSVDPRALDSAAQVVGFATDCRPDQVHLLSPDGVDLRYTRQEVDARARVEELLDTILGTGATRVQVRIDTRVDARVELRDGLPQDTLRNVRLLVEACLGLDAARGDTLTIRPAPGDAAELADIGFVLAQAAPDPWAAHWQAFWSTLCLGVALAALQLTKDIARPVREDCRERRA